MESCRRKRRSRRDTTCLSAISQLFIRFYLKAYIPQALGSQFERKSRQPKRPLSGWLPTSAAGATQSLASRLPPGRKAVWGMAEHPHHQRMMTSYLPAIWSRLEEAEHLATGADAMNNTAHIATLAGEVRILARAPELIRPTNPTL